MQKDDDRPFRNIEGVVKATIYKGSTQFAKNKLPSSRHGGPYELCPDDDNAPSLTTRQRSQQSGALKQVPATDKISQIFQLNAAPDWARPGSSRRVQSRELNTQINISRQQEHVKNLRDADYNLTGGDYPFSREMEHRHASIESRSEAAKQARKMKQDALQKAIAKQTKNNDGISCRAMFIPRVYEVKTCVSSTLPVCDPPASRERNRR